MQNAGGMTDREGNLCTKEKLKIPHGVPWARISPAIYTAA
jgi:hypothetical protein